MSVNWQETYGNSGIRVKLENDEVDGFGPETAYLSGVGKCEGGAYKCDVKYMIHDYEETTGMADYSKAEVTLFNGDSNGGHVEGTWKISDCPKSVSEDMF